jgi:glycosidase
MIHRFILVLLMLCMGASAIASPETRPHERWSSNATIYEVNIRQYTPEGTIAAFEKQLPRMKKMGVEILWVMPVQPIGTKNRKGSLGSYYAIRDYKAVNPEFGTQADFNRMVKSAHKLGMKVILDWVANHTAWDHDWASANPDWYKRNAKGEITSYEFDNGREIEYWTDVIGLDYRQPGVADAMIDAMRFWIREADIDGFRCDVASLVPIDFWKRARTELETEKPLFMLAESNDPAIHAAFDMSYDWALLDAFVEIAQGKADTSVLHKWAKTGQSGFSPNAYRMNFTSNHDVNSWRWSDKEMYGDKFRAFAVLAALLPGMPLVYSGQESGLDKKIAFFEKDAINWRSYENADFYGQLLKLKQRHPALRNGAVGANLAILSRPSDPVFIFQRGSGKRRVTAAINLSNAMQKLESVPEAGMIDLAPWSYVVTENGKAVLRAR